MILNKLFMQAIKRLPMAVRVLILVAMACLVILLIEGGNL